MKKDETMLKIYDVALDLFLKKGYEQVTVNEICKSVHITKPTFYAYNLQKEDMLIHVFERDLETSDPKWNECNDANWYAGIVRGIDLLVKRCIELGMDLWRPYLKICIDRGRTPVNISGAWREKMEKLIDLAREAGQIQAVQSAKALLHCILIYLMGVSYRLCMDEPVASVYQDVHNGIETILQKTPAEISPPV